MLAAEVLGEPITMAELDAKVRDVLFEDLTRDPARLHRLRSETLERLIDAKLRVAEAVRRGEQLDEQTAFDTAASRPISDEDVAVFWEEHGASMGGYTREQLEPSIRSYLERQRVRPIPRRVRERSGVAVHLQLPRVSVAADGPARGPREAPVTIVEFADFQCPYCRRSLATVRQVLEKYPEQVRLVYRHLPLEAAHGRARAAAEASACADSLGGFWPYHDKLFDNSQALERDDLLRYAEQSGIDVTAFAACIDERRFAAKVDDDLAAAKSLGIKGTPAFVINGVLLEGAKPAEAFFEIIEAELRNRHSS